MRFAAEVLTSVGLIWLIAPTALATTYTYTGSNFTLFATPYTASGSITIIFEVGTALSGGLVDADITASIVSFTASDGVQLYTQAQVFGDVEFRVSTALNGNIVNWAIMLAAPLSNPAGFIMSFNGLATEFALTTGICPIPHCVRGVASTDGGIVAFGIVDGLPGTWAAFPAPAVPSLSRWGIAVLAGALGVVVYVRRPGNVAV
jgi:hypothetical protein